MCPYPLVAAIRRVFLPLLRSRKDIFEVGGDVFAQEFEDVVLVCCGVVGYFGAEGEGDDAGDAGAEFEDCGGGCEERVGGEEVCGGAEPLGEEGGDFPDDWMRISV